MFQSPPAHLMVTGRCALVMDVRIRRTQEAVVSESMLGRRIPSQPHVVARIVFVSRSKRQSPAFTL